MRSTYWAGKLAPGEVALFHFDGKRRMLCNADGSFGSARPAVFQTVDVADAYARRYVEANPRRGCRIYDAGGACIREIAGSAVPERHYTRAAAKRDLCVGLLGFLLIPVGFLIDAWVGWSLFLGMALGTKFVMLGIIKLSDGLAGLMDTRPR